jgi:hypothetical protein
LNKVSYKKSEIALIQLRGAVLLFNEGDYVSSLTLAGATHEIIFNLCRARGLTWTFKLPAEVLPELKNKTGEDLEKFVTTTLNKTRNKLKHHESYKDKIVVADFYFEAEMFILNTIENYKLLFGKLPEDKAILDFFNKFN